MTKKKYRKYSKTNILHPFRVQRYEISAITLTPTQLYKHEIRKRQNHCKTWKANALELSNYYRRIY